MRTRSNPSAWERLSDADIKAIRAHDDDDQFLYHVTTPAAAQGILRHGLCPNQRGVFSESGLDLEGHCRGRVFVTERGGVSFWRSRVEEMLEYLGRPTRTTVLRIPREMLEGPSLMTDPRGSEDAPARAWMSTETLGFIPRRRKR